MNFWKNYNYLVCILLLWCGEVIYALDTDMDSNVASVNIASSSSTNRAHAMYTELGVDTSIPSNSTTDSAAQKDITDFRAYAEYDTRINTSSSSSNLLRSIAILFTPPDSTTAGDATASATSAAPPDSTTAGNATASATSAAPPDSTTAHSATSSTHLARLHVELALTPEERQRGLMHRTSIGQDSGMLFVYSTPRELSFWMKDTSLALSIAFISRDGTIISIADLEPFSLVSVPSAGDAQYALEVGRGYFAQHGITPGAQLILQECPTRIALLRHAPQKVAGAVSRLCP